jgi:hypothetical protein
MRTVLDGARAARREAWIATLRGSRMAPSSRETFEGSLLESTWASTLWKEGKLTYNNTQQDG